MNSFVDFWSWRWLLVGWLAWAGGIPTLAAPAGRAAGTILKVLPHLVDDRGRVAVAPSLYQRDAYQAHLRQNPQLVSTVRFDVNARVGRSAAEPGRLRLTCRTALREPSNPVVLEVPVRPGRGRRSWTTLTVDPETYRTAGKVLSWRAELLEGETVVSSQQSFLW